jgi:hypothetical protein
VGEHFERRRASLLEAIAEHERGELDHHGLQASVQAALGALDHTHANVRRALFEADVALEYAIHGRPVIDGDQAAQLKRMRRNLREALA